jgi:SPP1 gp7 family putative phage head morphogenesis protein
LDKVCPHPEHHAVPLSPAGGGSTTIVGEETTGGGLEAWQPLLDRIIKKIWKNKAIPDELDNDIIKRFANEFFNAMAEGLAADETFNIDETDNQDFISALVNDVWQFSGAKNYQQMKDITMQLVDGAGKLRTFRDFKFEAGKINADYAGTWLKTEYNNAVASSQMGAKWQQIQKDKEILPYLQYETAGDERVRLEHQELDHIVRKVDDEFWGLYYPPNGWNCRCTVRQLSYVKKETDLSKVSLPDVPKLFQINVGKEQKLFPPDHPYYAGLPADAIEQINELKKKMRKDEA